jgi:hypothetical protein
MLRSPLFRIIAAFRLARLRHSAAGKREPYDVGSGDRSLGSRGRDRDFDSVNTAAGQSKRSATGKFGLGKVFWTSSILRPRSDKRDNGFLPSAIKWASISANEILGTRFRHSGGRKVTFF